MTTFRALVTLAIAILCNFSVAHAAKRKVPPPAVAERLTTLRTGVLTAVVSGKGGESTTRLLTSRVVNAGDVEARDISVFVEGAKGLVIPLRGPKRLAPRAVGVYVTSFRLPAGVPIKSHATAVCSTCRR
jgi:hypothetical protein